MRKIFLLLVLSLGFADAACAVISVTQAASNQVVATCSTSCTDVITPGSATTAGHLLMLVAKAGASSSATFSISDSASQTWTAAGCGILRSGSDAEQVFWVANAASITTATITWSVNTGSVTIAGTLYEVAGIATSAPEDGCVTSTVASGTSITSGTLTTTNANDILMFAVGLSTSTTGASCAAGWIPGASYAIATGGCNIAGRAAISNRIVSATQSAVTTTMGENTAGAILLGVFVAFADTPVTPSACGTKSLALVGAGCG